MTSKKELRRYLLELTREELVKEVEKLYKKFQPVQQFYSLELGNDSTTLLSQYKKRLEKIFYPKGNYLNPSMSEANKVIKEFSKISVHMVDTIDLLLYRAELSIKLFEDWGLEFTSVVNSFVSGYDTIISLIRKNNLEEYFRDRCENIEGYALNYGLINETL